MAMGHVLIIPVPKTLFLTHSNLSGAPCYPRASRGRHTQTTHGCRPFPLSPLTSKSLQLSSLELTHNPCLSQLMNCSAGVGGGGTELFVHHCSQATGLHFNSTPRTRPPPEATCPEPGHWGSAWDVPSVGTLGAYRVGAAYSLHA